MGWSSAGLWRTGKVGWIIDSKNRKILEDFRKAKPEFLQLETIVAEKLQTILSASGIPVMGLEHRIKSENSLSGKLYRSGDSYLKMEDITDLFGARVILYFSDDVDKVGKLIENNFEIDWNRSSDKRALLDPNAFGYLSLHYICRLPGDAGYADSLSKIRFEIQIRSILQHAWAQIEHDMGYKSQFGVPRMVTREFARLSGLLELADEEFIRTRNHINTYIQETREKIKNNCADDVSIDLVSLHEYMLHNQEMRSFLKELADIEGSEICEVDPECYISQLKWLGISSIGQLQGMLQKNRALACKLARNVLAGSELDILASNVALRFLCQAELLQGGYTQSQAVEFFGLTAKTSTRAEKQAARLFRDDPTILEEKSHE